MFLLISIINIKFITDYQKSDQIFQNGFNRIMYKISYLNKVKNAIQAGLTANLKDYMQVLRYTINSDHEFKAYLRLKVFVDDQNHREEKAFRNDIVNMMKIYHADIYSLYKGRNQKTTFFIWLTAIFIIATTAICIRTAFNITDKQKQVDQVSGQGL